MSATNHDDAGAFNHTNTSEARTRALAQLEQLTLEEKVLFCSGKNFWELESLDRLGIPSIMMTDGPHGLRKQQGSSDHLGINLSVPATCFPTASLLAATWNAPLLYEMGVALAKECLTERVSVLLGPGVNIKRSPLGGRNFEYFSEDPFLSAELSTELIKGVQSLNVGTSLKHFAVNNQEYRRMVTNAIVDERTLREIYLASFEKPVKEGKPKTIMSAYNRLNGTYCSENAYLLNRILREEWGFEGVVVTDWGANNQRVPGLMAGQDIEMPGASKETNQQILKAVMQGDVSAEILDQSVLRVLDLIETTKPSAEGSHSGYDQEAHHVLAQKIASEGIVLLKNDALLPLSHHDQIAIVGKMAKVPRYQGSGSSYMNPTKLDSFFDQMAQRSAVTYADGYGDDGEVVDLDLIAKACDVAAKSEKVCVMIGLTEAYESEGFDRKSLALPKAHDELVRCLLAVNPNIVVILSNGAPVAMPWVDEVPSIIEGYLNGQGGASALVDVIYGDVNPSGHLAETFPLNLEASKYFPGDKREVIYKEGLYIGYRYYERFKQKVLFPFGHGLSYTSFELSELEAFPELQSNQVLKVAFNVKNTGKVYGKAVVQLYVKDEQSRVHRPEKELKGFLKIGLEPQQEQKCHLYLDIRAFSFFDVNQNTWVAEDGAFIIGLGFSSDDMRGYVSVYLEENKVIKTESKGSYIDEKESHKSPWEILEQEFEQTLEQTQNRTGDQSPSQTLKKSLSSSSVLTPKEYTLNTPIADMKASVVKSLLMAVIKSGTQKMMKQQNNAGMKKMIESVIDEINLRNLVMMSNGVIKLKTAETLLLFLKGHPLKGLKRLLMR